MKQSFWQFRVPLLVVVLAASMSAQNGGLRFTITDLGPHGLFSIAHGINYKGDIVGTVAASGGGQKCFLLPRGGKMIYFAGDTTVPYCDAVAISSQGVIAGTITYQKSPGPLAFRRAPNGVITTLQSPSGVGYDEAFAINTKGFVVGRSRSWGYPVVWDFNGNATWVSTVYSGVATGINDLGEIVGWDDSVWGTQCCMAWTSKNGVLTHLPTLGDRFGGWAWAINKGGFVAGAGIEEPFWYPDYPFEEVFWNTNAPGNPISDFGYTLGFMQSAVAISSDNWLVGGYREDTVVYVNIQVPNPSDAFLVVTNAGGCPLTPLLNLLDSSGSAWSNLVVANGINDSHQIVGYGKRNDDSQVHAFLLTPNNLPLCYPD